jgi:hypothetical protein
VRFLRRRAFFHERDFRLSTFGRDKATARNAPY